MNTALLSALHEIETDKGIPFETVKGVLEAVCMGVAASSFRARAAVA